MRSAREDLCCFARIGGILAAPSRMRFEIAMFALRVVTSRDFPSFSYAYLIRRGELSTKSIEEQTAQCLNPCVGYGNRRHSQKCAFASEHRLPERLG